MPLSDPENDIQCKNYPVYNHPLGVIKTERRTKKQWRSRDLWYRVVLSIDRNNMVKIKYDKRIA